MSFIEFAESIYSAYFLIFYGIVVAAISFVAFYQRRHEKYGVICLSAKWFLAMALGGISVSAFYYAIVEAALDGHEIPLVLMSRLIFFFLLSATALLSLSVVKNQSG